METNKEKKKEIKMQFIKTDDLTVAEQLRANGYTELTEQSTIGYCFLNDGKLTFDCDEEMTKKIYYTNIMCI